MSLITITRMWVTLSQLVPNQLARVLYLDLMALAYQKQLPYTLKDQECAAALLLAEKKLISFKNGKVTAVNPLPTTEQNPYAALAKKPEVHSVVQMLAMFREFQKSSRTPKARHPTDMALMRRMCRHFGYRATLESFQPFFKDQERVNYSLTSLYRYLESQRKLVKV